MFAWLKQATFAARIACGLIFLSIFVDVVKLVLNVSYAIRYPGVENMLVDPLTGFVFDLLVIAVAASLVRHLFIRRVWPALLAAIIMPLLYVLMLDGLAAAITHQESYFSLQTGWLFVVELVPTCSLVSLFGAEAVRNALRPHTLEPMESGPE